MSIIKSIIHRFSCSIIKNKTSSTNSYEIKYIRKYVIPFISFNDRIDIIDHVISTILTNRLHNKESYVSTLLADRIKDYIELIINQTPGNHTYLDGVTYNKPLPIDLNNIPKYILIRLVFPKYSIKTALDIEHVSINSIYDILLDIPLICSPTDLISHSTRNT